MKYFSISFFLLLQLAGKCQHYLFPPAQGPLPGSGNIVLPVYVSTIYSMLDNYLRDSVLPAMNETLKAKSFVPVSVSHKTKQLMPVISQTTRQDKPNEKLVVIPFEVSYKLNITGFPDRYLRQTINIKAYCNNWAAPDGGNIRVVAVAEQAQLVGESLLEQIIDAVSLENITSRINSTINNNMPGLIIRTLLNSDIKCNCLSLEPGEPPTYEGVIKYYNKSLPTYSERNGYSVSIKKIKKLSPSTIEGSPLFTNPENFQVRYYVNQKSESSSISGIQPGQERNFPNNDFFIPKPSQDGKIVIIIAIDRGVETNAGHIVLSESTNFGFGLKKLFIQRSYKTDPKILPNGTVVKGSEVKANAYEVTVEVKRVNRNETDVKRN
ncbi:MAG: hypothetical protein RIR12_2613 [Bacteroidota bacterium]|jgi:hypothetical protein